MGARKVAVQLEGDGLAEQVMQAEGNLTAAKPTLEQAEIEYNYG